MTDTQKATPRPWRVVTGAVTIAAGRHRVRIAADQEAMADAIATRKNVAITRAERIVTAVNTYDAMREALRLAESALRDAVAGYEAMAKRESHSRFKTAMLSDAKRCQIASAQITAALEAAEGKEGSDVHATS